MRIYFFFLFLTFYKILWISSEIYFSLTKWQKIIEYVFVSWFSFFFCSVILEFAKNLSEQTGVFKTVQASTSTNELLRNVKYYVLHLCTLQIRDWKNNNNRFPFTNYSKNFGFVSRLRLYATLTLQNTLKSLFTSSRPVINRTT